MTEHEEAMINEAFTIGRIYARMDEKESPHEIHEKLMKNCEQAGRAVSSGAAKRYDIVTVEDFTKIPADKVGYCLAEFRVALEAHKLTSKFLKDAGKQIDEKTKAKLKFKHFIWMDDGKNNMEIRLWGRE